MSRSMQHAMSAIAAWASRPTKAGGLGVILLSWAAITPASAANYLNLYNFHGSPDGSQPYGRLVADTSGMLYGTTDTGGVGGGGTVFRFDPATGQVTTLYSFTTFGPKGSGPAAGVILGANGLLYGTTETGGTGTCSLGCGTVFRLNPVTSDLTTLVDFQNDAQGIRPHGLVLHGGLLYGTTIYGGYIPGPGNSGGGTLFSVNPITKSFTKLHNFSEPGVNDGALPVTMLVPGPDGRMYGLADSGGANGAGAVFALNTTTLAFSVIHSFDYHVDGAHPQGKLLVRNGNLLGTTRAGGPTAASQGVVYSLNPTTGVLTNLYSFSGGNDGANVQFGVTKGPQGRVYGTSTEGGLSGGGTIFSVNPATHAHTILYNFDARTGYFPSGELLLQGGNTFYGVSTGGNGSIYKLVP